RTAPPMADDGVAIAPGSRPDTTSTSASTLASPATKAETISSKRVVRADIDDILEASCDAGRDHLVEHRASVMRPQRDRAGEQHAGRSCDEQQGARHMALR